MKNLESFDNHSLNERVQAKIIKDLIKGKENLALQHIRDYVDLSRLTDADVEEITDPKVLTKKPYTGNNYLILAYHEHTKRIPGYEDKETGKYVHSRTEPDGEKLYYIVHGTDVYVIHGESGRRGRDVPSRKALFDSKSYRFFAIKVGDKTTKWDDDDWFKFSKVREIRKQREQQKANATALHDPESIAKSNQSRYKDAVKKIQNFDHIFDEIAKLVEKANAEDLLTIEAYKYLAKDQVSDRNKISQISSKLKQATSVDKAFVQSFEKFYSSFKYDDTVYTKVSFLQKLAKELMDLLHNSYDKEALDKIKALPPLLKTIPFDNVAESIITENAWRKSDKLNALSKATGIFEN